MKSRVLMLVLASAVPLAAEPAVPLHLTLKSAVDLALAPDGNARVQLAAEMVKQAEALSGEARAALLPNLEGQFTALNQTRNLAAFGIQIHIPVPGFTFPEFAGPYNSLDARASATQSILDLSAVRRYQASKAGVKAARAENDSAQHQTISQVAKAYLNALRTKAALDAGEANVDLAQALARLAESQKRAGTGTGIEITRAQVQLANEQQKLLTARTEHNRAKLELLRAIGLPMDRPVELDGKLEFQPVENPDVEASIAAARGSRPDWTAQQSRERGAQLNYSAAKLERIPTLAAFGDYGSIGTAWDNSVATRTYGVSLRIPVFDGGRRDARRQESHALYRQERVRTRDIWQQVELEIRQAIESLHSGQAQVATAEDGLKLALRELAQAERRYKAGVSTSIEVIDAQTRLERARANRILALFSYNLARIDLETARGTVERLLP
ncbi:MAG: TolC family protein [Bryobacterales bacterium]|nr:TolC family protein [Bryobacterales bacterium]